MQLDDALKKVCVIGAGGKMGSGISLLLLQEMVRVEALQTGRMATGAFRLWLIDANPAALEGLQSYLKTQLQKFAERHIVVVRNLFAHQPELVSNRDIVDYYVEKALSIAHFEGDLMQGAQAHLCFEAVLEDVEVKAHVFRTLAAESSNQRAIFSNTSSIPIHVLREKSKLDNRLMGFHFYNPPAVQKLVELIAPVGLDPEVDGWAHELVDRLHKIEVSSKDVAGFIGNGHFIRELLFGFRKAHVLSEEFSLSRALVLVNQVTQNFLIRPMGLFQLMDYVGIDVCYHICQTMKTYLPDSHLHEPLLDRLIAAGIIGGQHADGSQKEGLFKYENHQPVAVYSLEDKAYVPMKSGTDVLGELPQGYIPWKILHKASDREEKLKIYFHNLFKEQTRGAELAQAFLVDSHEIARLLVEQGVAKHMGDIETVLKQGFYHLYGPEAEWLKRNEYVPL